MHRSFHIQYACERATRLNKCKRSTKSGEDRSGLTHDRNIDLQEDLFYLCGETYQLVPFVIAYLRWFGLPKKAIPANILAEAVLSS